MSGFAAAWLMATITDRVDLIALTQAAGYFPMLLLALPSGFLADRYHRRPLLIAIHIGLFIVVVVLAISSAVRPISPPVLLFPILIMGIGSAMASVFWQVAAPDLVPPALLPAAVTLGAAAFNLSRLIGPATASFVILAAGVPVAFAASAGLIAAALLLLLARRWPHPPAHRPESFTAAVHAAIRTATAVHPLRANAATCFLFTSCASALWALLPAIASQRPSLGVEVFGGLATALGLGAIMATLVLPSLRAVTPPKGLLALSGFGFGVSMVLLGFSVELWMACACAVATGGCWLAGMTTLSIAARESVPFQERGRAVAAFIFMFASGMTIGSAGWGRLAQSLGVQATLVIAAVALLGTVAAPQGLAWRPWTGPAPRAAQPQEKSHG